MSSASGFRWFASRVAPGRAVQQRKERGNGSIHRLSPREHQAQPVVVCCRRVGGMSVCCQPDGGVVVVHELEDYHEGGFVCLS